MTNIIRIKKAAFYAYHGVLSEEQTVGGKFEADIDMYTDFSGAAEHDNLKETINYHEVYKFMSKLVIEQKYYLLEALAMKIADELLSRFSALEKIAVRIRKNSPPLGGMVDCVEIEIIKERKDFES